MKIIMMTGSAHKNGTSAYLAEHFMRGAKEAGHEVSRFDTAFMDIHPCIGCDHCRRKDGCHADKSCEQRGCCGQKDDGVRMNELMREADVLVLASPVYWSGFTSQIKTAIDRFYASNAQIQTPKKAALLLTSGDAEWDVTAGAIGTYKGICGYLGWADGGIITAGGCGVLEEIKQTEFPQKAYLLGKNFGA